MLDPGCHCIVDYIKNCTFLCQDVGAIPDKEADVNYTGEGTATSTARHLALLNPTSTVDLR